MYRTNRQRPSDRPPARGNVLFLILMAMVLFAVLSYAVLQSSRVGGGESASEKMPINGVQITPYPASVRTAIVRMLIDNNIEVEQLEFNAPSDFASLTSEGSHAHAVFSPDGGVVSYESAPADIMNNNAAGTWYFNADFQVPLIGTTSTAGDAAGNDLIAFLPDIKHSVCQKINEQFGLPSNPVPVAQAIAMADVKKTQGTGGAYTTFPTAAGTSITSGATPDTLSGQPFGCFETTDAKYVYYHVLLER